jgi:hypothetical protein
MVNLTCCEGDYKSHINSELAARIERLGNTNSQWRKYSTKVKAPSIKTKERTTPNG